MAPTIARIWRGRTPRNRADPFFTSTDPTAVHHLDRDAEFLIELPESIQILQIRSSYGQLGGAEA